MPGWVLDYVLLHELAHTLHAGHGPQFWALLEAYPRTERARGFLEGFAFASDAGDGDTEPTPGDDADRADDLHQADHPALIDETDPADRDAPAADGPGSGSPAGR